MKRLAGRQTRFANKLEGRAGSLWESRYKISPFDTEAYLLQCCRYVELNPVKAGMVSKAEDYPWSSYPAKLGQVSCEWLDRDPTFIAVALRENERITRYRAFVESVGEAQEESDVIRLAAERNQLTGAQRFVDEVERRTGIRVEYRGRETKGDGK